ncbi:hypothetical protein [Proteus myxofaciens]|uniref:Lipoprotein n=1 Tax=Proteus myxofaciens ATCC 19692 TaxID=1354337 RepID=A0A198F894_9GAMM|nr:hypothetical protein [Proteus myxofaciens]OAT21088.1 hypothetical protein M983_3185 [Proteus myxofaciens ATCC 19692]
MYRYFYLTIIFCTNFFAVGCDRTISPTAQTGLFYISNNNNTPLEFYIDNTHFKINEGEIEKIKLEDGKHVLVDINGKKKIFMVYPGNQGGIINPSRAIYYSFTSVLTAKEDPNNFYLNTQSVWVNGQLISGAINSSDAMFIDNNVFHCNVPIGETINTYLDDRKDKAVANVLTKCYSQVSFGKLLLKNPEGIHFHSNIELLQDELNENKLNWINEENTRTEDFIISLDKIKFNNNKLVKEAKQINNIIYQYLSSRDVNDRRTYYNAYHSHIMNMAKIYHEQIQSNMFDDKDAYIKLILETSKIFDAGVLSEPILI